MTQLAITGGYYVAKSIIANAQRCMNLYPERNPPDSPFPFTDYLTPGLTPVLALDTGIVRGLYRSGNGMLFAVGGQYLYYISPQMIATQLGKITTSVNPVSMSDNQLVLIVVDGTTNGYYVDLSGGPPDGSDFGQITAAAFYGANKVDIVDTFFVFNQPGTSNWYISTSQIDKALIVGGGVAFGTFTGGTGYSDGIHASVPLTGGSGAGATADITVGSGTVTAVALDAGTESAPYQIGDVLSAAPGSPGGLGGGVTGQSAIGGVGYTTGTYTGVPLTGGSGSLAVATIVVSSASVVTGVTITTPGQDYIVGDLLGASSASIGGTGTGFGVEVTSINAAGTGFAYTVTAVDAGSLAFDPLDIASKSGSSDILVSLIAIHREVHLIGALTSEVWYDAGTPDFVFGILEGIFYEHGIVAVYSLAKTDLACFWLGQDKQGQAVVYQEMAYVVTEISTPAIVNAIQKYSIINDAIGFTYQIEGHVFYVLTFPTADRTWVYDLETKLWHEWLWTDDQGAEHRHRANCQAFAYGINLVGDWQNGQIYALDVTNITDAGAAIVRRRGFPHIVNEGKRLSYDRFIVEMDVGLGGGTTEEPAAYALTTDTGADALSVDDAINALLVYDAGDFMNTTLSLTAISLRWSDTKGRTWNNPIILDIGAEGDYWRSIQARQLGMARDRVFEVFWSGAFPTAINGAYVDITPAET